MGKTNAGNAAVLALIQSKSVALHALVQAGQLTLEQACLAAGIVSNGVQGTAQQAKAVEAPKEFQIKLSPSPFVTPEGESIAMVQVGWKKSISLNLYRKIQHGPKL